MDLILTTKWYVVVPIRFFAGCAGGRCIQDRQFGERRRSPPTGSIGLVPSPALQSLVLPALVMTRAKTAHLHRQLISDYLLSPQYYYIIQISYYKNICAILRLFRTIQRRVTLILVVRDHQSSRVDLAQGFKCDRYHNEQTSTADREVSSIDS